MTSQIQEQENWGGGGGGGEQQPILFTKKYSMFKISFPKETTKESIAAAQAIWFEIGKFTTNSRKLSR